MARHSVEQAAYRACINKPDSEMNEEWFIHSDGRQHGPYPLVEVFDMIDRGRVPESAWFVCGGVRVDRSTLLSRWADPRITLVPVGPEDVAATPMGPEVEFLPAATVVPAASPDGMASASATTEPQPPAVSDVGLSTVDALPSAAPPVERDCVLILGRRRAGKTIFLSTLYAMLWKSSGGLTMKALSGATHKALIGVVNQLKHGQWPEATLGARQMEFELNDHHHKRLLVALDYSGEDFRRAFVDEDHQSNEVKKLLHYLDRAMAVILLMDASVAVKDDPDESVDDDFGMVQAVERLRNWPGGENVPVVLAMTKADRNRKVLLAAGTMREFVQRHYPALLRTCPKLSIFAVSAVQEHRDEQGVRRPKRDSSPVNLEKPLLHCLEQLRKRETEKQRRERERAVQEAELALVRQEEARVHAQNRRAAFIVAAILIVGMCVCALIWFLAD